MDGFVHGGPLTVKLLLVPLMPLLLPIPVAVRLKLPGYVPEVEKVTLHGDRTPLTNALLVPPPADRVPLEGLIFTLKPFALNVVSVLPLESIALTLVSNGVPAVCVPMLPSLVLVTLKLAKAPGTTVRFELAGPVVVPSLAVIVVVSALRSVVASVVVETPLVKLTAVV